jgi:hypothetical protein
MLGPIKCILFTPIVQVINTGTTNNKRTQDQVTDVIEREEEDDEEGKDGRKKRNNARPQYPNNAATEKDFHWWLNGKNQV